MLSNEQFLEVIKQSFAAYLSAGTSRSTAKLKDLHGYIAQDIQEVFGKNYTVQSQGFGNGKEGCIEGRYYPKNVDIAVWKGETPVAGYAVKFVMRNYSQNSNNYFENMLGETANIRSNGVPYFQIFIIFDEVPYYSRGGEFQKYDVLTKHNLEKYYILSRDNSSLFYHTPEKTLLTVLHLKDKPLHGFDNEKEYARYYQARINNTGFLSYSSAIQDDFGNGIILNDYQRFIEKTYYITEGNLK